MKNIIGMLWVLLLVCAPVVFAEGQLLDRVVAVVNDEAITQSELDILLRPFYDQFKEEYQGQDLFRKLTEARRKLLNQLIEDRLVFQEAEEQEIEADEGEVNEMLDHFRDRFPTEEDMEKTLRQQGMTLMKVRERLRRQLMIKTLHDMEIRSKVVVSPMEIEQYYQDHVEEFTEKEQIRIRSITIKKNEEARDKGLKDEEAWQLVQEIDKGLLGGSDFGELADRYSEDVHAERGGLGGWIGRGEMIPAIDEVIFKLKPGEVSEVIETSMGYHLFRIEERKEGVQRKFEEVRDQIFSTLFQEKGHERFRVWMQELKNKAYISVR